MSKIKLDLNQFKHIKSDKDSTTLKHKLGHTLTLANKALSPEAQEQLKALSSVSTQDQTQLQAEQAKHESDYKMSKGGKVKMEEGGKVPVPDTQAKGKPSPQNYEPPKKVFGITVPGTGSQPVIPQESQQVNKAKGGRVQKFANHSDYVHSADNYGGGKNYSMPPDANTTTADDDIASEVQANELAGQREAAKASKEVPDQQQDINKAADQLQDIGGVKKIIPDMGESPAQPQETDLGTHLVYLAGKYGVAPILNQLNNMSYAIKNVGEQAGKLTQKGEEIGKGLIAGAEGRPETPTTPQAVIKQDPPEPPAPPVIQPPAALPQPTPDQIQDTQAAAASPSLQADIALTNNTMGMAQQGYANQVQAENAKAAAIKDQSSSEAYSLRQDAQAKQDMLANFQNTYNILDKERLAHIQDIQNGYVDPNAYWQDHSKIASGIGMILAGFNPAGKPNAAIDFLKYQMDKNIDAQKTNLSAKNNLLYANLQQFNNAKQAVDMTRIMQNDVITNQLQQAAVGAKTPMAKAAAQAAIGQIQMQSSQIFRNLAMMQTVMNQVNKGGFQNEADFKAMTTMMRMQGMGQEAKDMEAKHIPGVPGFASQEVDQGIKSKMIAMDILDNKGKDVLNFVEKHKGTWNPQTRAVAAQKIEEMKNFYNDSIKGGALTQGRLGWYDEQFAKHPTDILAQMMGSTAKLKEMVDSNANRRNIELKDLGFPVQAQPQQDNQVIIGKDGKQYRRQGDYMVPVK